MRPSCPILSAATRRQAKSRREIRVSATPRPLPEQRGENANDGCEATACKAFSHAGHVQASLAGGERGTKQGFFPCSTPRHTTSRQKHVTPEAPRFLDAGSLATACCCELLHVASSRAAPGGPAHQSAVGCSLSPLVFFGKRRVTGSPPKSHPKFENRH